jgi:hypothetical protein
MTLPEIQRLGTGHYFCDGAGLRLPATATRIIKMSGGGAFEIANTRNIDSSKKGYTDKEMEGILYAYIESHLPVILGVDANKLEWWKERKKSKESFHAILCIGHTMKNDKINGYIFHDESAYPYQKLTTAGLLKAWRVPENYSLMKKPIRYAVVGVPPNVTVNYEIARVAASLLVRILESGRKLKNIFGLRPILLSKEQMVAILEKNKLKEIESIMKLPNWSWVFMILTKSTQRLSGECYGFFIFDATTLIPHKVGKSEPKVLLLPPTVLVTVGNDIYVVDREGKPRKFIFENGKLTEQVDNKSSRA